MSQIYGNVNLFYEIIKKITFYKSLWERTVFNIMRYQILSGRTAKEMFKENSAIPEPSGFMPSSTSLSSLPVPSHSSNKSHLLNSNFEIETHPELDQSMSQIDFENLEVTDEVGEQSSEETIEIEREEGLGSRDEKK
jgi:hypothetical protein